MVCRLRLTRQSWQPEVHKLTPPSPDPSWRFAPPIQKLSVPFLGPGFLDESETLESKTLKRGARQASLLHGWPRWQQAAVVKHILRQIGDLEHQYYLRLFFWQIISSQQETRSVNACTTWETWMWSSVRLFWGDDWFVHRLLYQSCEMSMLLHRAKLSNQILPEEKRVNRDSFGTKSEQN